MVRMWWLKYIQTPLEFITKEAPKNISRNYWWISSHFYILDCTCFILLITNGKNLTEFNFKVLPISLKRLRLWRKNWSPIWLKNVGSGFKIIFGMRQFWITRIPNSIPPQVLSLMIPLGKFVIIQMRTQKYRLIFMRGIFHMMTLYVLICLTLDLPYINNKIMIYLFLHGALWVFL